MTNLALNLSESADMYPDRPALREGDMTVSYSEFHDLAGRLASFAASRGIMAGDRVGLMLPNVVPFPVIAYGVLRVGAVLVPMNPLLKRGEVEYYLADSGAKVLFAWHEVEAEAAAGAEAVGAQLVVVGPDFLESSLGGLDASGTPASRADDDTAVILYTSGTTGKPKGAELTHANLNSNQSLTAMTLLELTAEDVVMGCLPLFHVFGLTCGLNASIASGSLLTLLPRFDGRAALQVLQRDRVTVFLGVPTMYSAFLAVPDHDSFDVSSLRTCVSGGAALPVEVLRRFENSFDAVILEGYGLSESSPVACFNHPDRPRKAGTIGTPVQGVQMRLVDADGGVVTGGAVGEIQIKGANVMKGYWNRPEATAETVRDGWLSTGDMAVVDEDGYYSIVDRKKDLIIRGGYNVYPRQVEEVLYEHPAVAEVAVIGIPHATLGEEVGAAVALRAGVDAKPDELIAFVKEKIAAYKYPRSVWVVEALPKGPTGKVLRRQVKAPADVAAKFAGESQ